MVKVFPVKTVLAFCIASVRNNEEKVAPPDVTGEPSEEELDILLVIFHVLMEIMSVLKLDMLEKFPDYPGDPKYFINIFNY